MALNPCPLRAFRNLAVVVACLSVMSIKASGKELWQPNTAAALETAENQQAPIIVLLRVEAHGDTGLGSQIEASIKKLAVQPVGLELVYPRQAYAHPGVAREFIHWADLVGATRLPALAWLGEDGRPYGLIELAPEATALPLDRRLEAMRDRYTSSLAAYNRAQELTGSDRAQALHEYLQLIDLPCRASYQDVMAQILALDPDNTLGLRSVYQPVLIETTINATIQEQVYPLIDAGAFGQAHEALSKLLHEHPVTTEQRQLLMAFQAQLLHSEGRTPQAIALIDQAMQLNAEGATREKLVMARLQFMSD